MPMMIVFDKPLYSPGSVVSGQLVISKKSPEKVKGLTMRFIGRSSKVVSEMDNVRNFKKEVYFDEKFDLFGHDGTNTLLKVGETLFPFTFNLPPGIPSSFVWTGGSVLYFAEARLTRSSWKDDKKASSRMEVEGIFDLNLDPIAILPTEATRYKYVQHLLSKSGPFGFSFKITRSGFVRGHGIPFTTEIKNLSKLHAKKLRISLVQEITSEGQIYSKVIEELKGPGVLSGEVQTWDSRLKIPLVQPTNLGNLLHYPVSIPLQYFIRVELGLKSATVEPLFAKIPIRIGTISLLRSRDRLRLQQLQGNAYHWNPPQHQHHHPTAHSPAIAHDHSCPLSQLNSLPVVMNPSPSQFSPNFLPPNSSGGITVHSSLVVTQNRNIPYDPSHSVIYSPNRGFDYALINDENRFPRRYPGGRHFGGRRSRQQFNIIDHRESPPPSYDEVCLLQEPRPEDTPEDPSYPTNSSQEDVIMSCQKPLIEIQSSCKLPNVLKIQVEQPHEQQPPAQSSSSINFDNMEIHCNSDDDDPADDDEPVPILVTEEPQNEITSTVIVCNRELDNASAESLQITIVPCLV